MKITDEVGVLRIALCSHDLRKVVNELNTQSTKFGAGSFATDDETVIKKL